MTVTTGGRNCRFEFLYEELRRIRVEHVRAPHRLALLHQEFQNICLPLVHAVGEIGHGDGLRQDDFARHLFRGAAGHLEPAFTLAFARALHGGVGSLLFFLIAQGGRNRQAPLTALRLVLGTMGLFADRLVIASAGLGALDAPTDFPERIFFRIQRHERTRTPGRTAIGAGTRCTARTWWAAVAAGPWPAVAGRARSTVAAWTQGDAVRTHAHRSARRTRGSIASSACRSAASTFAAETAFAAFAALGIFFFGWRGFPAGDRLGPAFFLVGYPARFFLSPPVGFLDRFGFGLTPLFVGAAQGKRRLARLQLGFGE
jgi:hypothetical protein